jgi:putative ABC transport system ATP-binding protein
MRTTISKYDLSLQHVTKGFDIEGDRRIILSDFSYTFLPGVSYAIIGASGSGKSTLLHLLAGFEAVDSGVVLWAGRSVAELSSYERDTFIGQHIGFVFQSHYLIPELSVYDNVRVAGLLAGVDSSKEAISPLLRAIGLSEHAYHLPHQLSGGQQQRAALARALIKKPTFLIADEPTGSLDAKTGSEIITICRLYQQEYGMGLIVATHDRSVYEMMEVIVSVG